MKRRRLQKREGAAMLVVLMVLIGTTATATFAIHSTSIEMRSAGHARQAMQTGYLAEAGVVSAIATMDISPAAALTSSRRTQVAAGTVPGPGRPRLSQDIGMYILESDDLTSTMAVTAPAVETDVARGPSLGPRDVMVPTFRAEGVDIHEVPPLRAGAELSGNSNLTYYYMNLTSRASLAPATDYVRTGDPRSYHQSSGAARALTVAGPVPRQ